MRLFDNRFLVLTAFIAATVFISNVNAKHRPKTHHTVYKPVKRHKGEHGHKKHDLPRWPVHVHKHTHESPTYDMPNRKINTYYYRTRYVYAPPRRIYFRHSHGSVKNYPVYNDHNIPSYVNDYWQSENKYGNLITGLALYNLGMLSDSQSKKEFHDQYVQKPDEICTFEVKYETGNTDEMAIDCILMTYFIFTEEYENHILDGSPVNNNGSDVTSIIIHRTTIKDMIFIFFCGMLINGTLQTMQPEGTIVNQVFDPIFYGRPVDYKLLRECNIGRSKLGFGFKKEIPCGLLQTYAEKSWRANSGPVLKTSLLVILISVCVIFI